MALEKWIAIASVGLFAMFAGEMISIYHFMLQAPEDMEFGIVFEPDPKILQFISIGVAPASVMAGVSFIMSKRYGSKQIGIMIISGGIIMLLGMIYCYSLVDKISEAYISEAVRITPPIFMGISFPVILFGVQLLRVKRKRPKKDLL